MPPDQTKPPESSGVPDLPRFADRLPDLLDALRQGAASLDASPAKQSYIPFFEDMYAVAHSLKGVLQILACPAEVAIAITTLSETLVAALAGNYICRKNKEAGALLAEFAGLLDQPDLTVLKSADLVKPLEALKALYQEDIPHEERLKEIPSHLFYVNEFVSKKARETNLLGLHHAVVEILLDEIPLWRTQLEEALSSEEFGRGLVVNFLPFLSPEGSRKLKVWAWISAATHSRAALKQRVKEVMPKVLLTKL
jgi:hypothetical protein